jgi:hypothetical protein
VQNTSIHILKANKPIPISYALKHGYRVSLNDVPSYLQFADSTYQETEGQVQTFWTFGSGWQIPISFEVLKDCASDVIIGEDIIHGYSIYETYAPYIKEIESNCDSYELAPFDFFKGWQRPKAKPAGKSKASSISIVKIIKFALNSRRSFQGSFSSRGGDATTYGLEHSYRLRQVCSTV